MPKRIIISGGGTGGHIFPAVAIANEFRRRDPNCEILFVGAKGRMEMQKVPDAGYEIEGLWISGIQRKLSIDNLSFPFKVIDSLVKAHGILKRFKPDLAIGVGGFASGPLLHAATAKGIPALIQEQNSFPGITNKLLKNRVQRICVAFEGMQQFFPKEKIVITGNPVRTEMVQIEGKRNKAFEFFGLDKTKPTILVVGGSLGARSVNFALKDKLQHFVDAGVQVIWQTGKTTYDECKTAASDFADKGIHVTEFIKPMDLAYAAADLVISRAGAIAISELCLVHKPCILVPFPHAAEDHQTKNAMALVDNDAALLIKDHEAKENLVEKALTLMADKQRLSEMSGKMKELGRENAVGKIVDEAIGLVKGGE